MSAKVKNITLNSILNDKTSGSSEILSDLNSFFLKKAGNPAIIRADIPLLKMRLKHFTVIINYLNKLELILGKNDIRKLKEYLNEFSRKEENSFQIMCRKCGEYLDGKKKFLTLSNSKTLLEVFSRLQKEKNNLTVTILESLPGNEGIVLAGKLSKKGVKTKVIPDSAASQFIQYSDAVIIGADQILRNGNVVNKSGSRNAAIICKYFGIPFYVLASKEKFSNRQKRVIFGENNRGKSKPHISILEEIDKTLITKIITD